MIYPYENYLNLLVVRGFDNATIYKKIRSMCSLPPTEAEIAEKKGEVLGLLPGPLVAQLALGPNHHEYTKVMTKYAASLAAIDSEDVAPVLTQKRLPAWDEALYIISDPEVKLATQCLTLFEFPVESVLEILNNKYSAKLSLDGLKMYLKYFWNTSRMSKLELFHFISNMESSKARTSLLEAFHKRTDVIKWKYIGESVLTFENILKEVMNEAFMKFRSSIKESTPDDIAKVSQWASLAMRAAEKYDKLFKKADINILEQLQFELEKRSQSTVPLKDKIDGDVL